MTAQATAPVAITNLTVDSLGLLYVLFCNVVIPVVLSNNAAIGLRVHAGLLEVLPPIGSRRQQHSNALEKRQQAPIRGHLSFSGFDVAKDSQTATVFFRIRAGLFRLPEVILEVSLFDRQSKRV
jgi:hypothetical protein